MATRKDMWIANEILRFTDIIHDCLDACRYLLRGLEPDRGTVITEDDIPEPGINPDTGLPFPKLTLEEYINLRIRSHSNAASTNKVALIDFITKIGITEARNALTFLGVDSEIVIADVDKMQGYATYIYNNTLTEDHAVMADYLDANLSKFISVRRRWAI